jgi:hypothetical protein
LTPCCFIFFGRVLRYFCVFLFFFSFLSWRLLACFNLTMYASIRATTLNSLLAYSQQTGLECLHSSLWYTLSCCSSRNQRTWVRAFISKYFEFPLIFLCVCVCGIFYSKFMDKLFFRLIRMSTGEIKKHKYLHMRTLLFISLRKKAGPPEWHKPLHTLPVGLNTKEDPGINWNANLTFESKTRLPKLPSHLAEEDVSRAWTSHKVYSYEKHVMSSQGNFRQCCSLSVDLKMVTAQFHTIFTSNIQPVPICVLVIADHFYLSWIFNDTLSVHVTRRHYWIRSSFFYSHSGGSPYWVHLARRPLNGLLYLPRLIMMTENLVEWRLAGETEVLGENVPQRHCVYHKFHLPDPMLEPVPPRWEASDLSYGAAIRSSCWNQNWRWKLRY